MTRDVRESAGTIPSSSAPGPLRSASGSGCHVRHHLVHRGVVFGQERSLVRGAGERWHRAEEIPDWIGSCCDDRLMGWGNFAAAGVDVQTIAGDHLTLLDRKNVASYVEVANSASEHWVAVPITSLSSAMLE